MTKGEKATLIEGFKRQLLPMVECMDFQRCLFCGGDASEPDHALHCDGRQGGIEDIPRFRDSSVQSFYNAVSTGKVKTLQQQVWTALHKLGKATQMETHRYYQSQGLVGDSHSITPRFAELRDLGVIREAGERACMITGQMSIVWEAVPLEDYKATPVVKHRCERCGQIVRRSLSKSA